MFGLTPFNRQTVNRSQNQDRFYDLVEDFFQNAWTPFRSLRNDTFKLDVKDEGAQYVVLADLPGVKKEEINLEYHDGYLTIRINKSETKEDQNKHYVHRERVETSMHRTIHLGDLKSDDIQAELKDGILTITAPKMEQVERVQRITIK